MVENPGTCFLQYPKLHINCCNFFLHWGICRSSVFLKIPGGITALPAIYQLPKNFPSLLGPRHFPGGIVTFLFYLVLTVLLLLPLPPPSQGKFHQSEYHLYIGTVSHLGGVRLSVKVQQVRHKQLWVNVYTPVGACLLYSLPSESKLHLLHLVHSHPWVGSRLQSIC